MTPFSERLTLSTSSACCSIVIFLWIMQENVKKSKEMNVGRVSVKTIIRNAKERRPGALGFAEALLIAYNAKNKYRLSIRKLYGKSDADDLEDPVDEEEYEDLS